MKLSAQRQRYVCTKIVVALESILPVKQRRTLFPSLRGLDLALEQFLELDWLGGSLRGCAFNT